LFGLLPAVVALIGSSSSSSAFVEASSSSASSSTAKGASSFPLEGIAPDPFVEASPLVVGVVCSDGVLLLALHLVFAEATDEGSSSSSSESALLLRDDSETTTDNNKSPHLDLPPSYRGPFRIHSLDASGNAAMVCAGWRSDSQLLAEQLRSVDRSETHVFGSRRRGASVGFLAHKAAGALARGAVTEGRRTLSCASLVAEASASGHLWVVDATGAYAVRAHALGRGSRVVNHYLRSQDWTLLDSATVQSLLLRHWGLLEQTNNAEGGDEKPNEATSISELQLPKGTRVEMALIESSPQTSSSSSKNRKPMRRLFAAST
jgi:hypothetical protein